MQMTIASQKIESPTRLENAWKKGAAPDEEPLGIKDRLRRHCDEQGGAELRKKAAVALILTAEFRLATDEMASPEVEDRLLEALKTWATLWVGSGPLAARVRRPAEEPRPSSRRKAGARVEAAKSKAAVLRAELVLAPVRPELRDGRETRRVVSINKALTELARVTFGPGGEARHAEALHVSGLAHLAGALPDLRITLSQPPASQEPEVIRLRREELDRREAALSARETALQAFPSHTTEILKAIEAGLIFIDETGTLSAKKDFRLAEPVRAHFKQHRQTYSVVLGNPALVPGMRLMLEMVLGELGVEPAEPANEAAQPGTTEEAS